ncbi:hypothetical protein SAMN04488056_105251 [Cohaesibacter marisflavi]|uniref:Uncharacterized protein n=1 Tax=Cohaesibacter marisflavi TaxID=655353 RepID=A0A1I5GYD2_9HYPH|nr:hypothetical protein [Cohaesibacter marisflavi]SFO40806.1 hypothetical protein SAMN04488056_105251 [Cohaesibacter marisflavi]
MSKKGSYGDHGLTPDVEAKLKGFVLDELKTYVMTALLLKDDEVARTHLIQSVQSAFNAAFGGVLASLKSQVARKEKQVQSAQAELEEVKAELRTTSKQTASWRGNQGRDEADMIEAEFCEWQSRHRVEATILLIVTMMAAVASFITAYTNLVGSGVVVFLDNPLLPASMAALAPLCGFAIKSVHGFLRSGWQTRSYIFSLVSAMLVSVCLWIVLYAGSYHGLSPNALSGGFLDDASWWDGVRDTIFIIVSLSTEILISAVFALRLTIIAGRYSPDYFRPNQDFIDLEKRESALEKHLLKLEDELDDLIAEHCRLEAELEGYINTALLMFEGRRGQPTPSIL